MALTKRWGRHRRKCNSDVDVINAVWLVYLFYNCLCYCPPTRPQNPRVQATASLQQWTVTWIQISALTKASASSRRSGSTPWAKSWAPSGRRRASATRKWGSTWTLSRTCVVPSVRRVHSSQESLNAHLLKGLALKSNSAEVTPTSSARIWTSVICADDFLNRPAGLGALQIAIGDLVTCS